MQIEVVSLSPGQKVELQPGHAVLFQVWNQNANSFIVLIGPKP